MKRWITALTLLIHGAAESRGVSIYNGEEKRFGDTDRARVLDVLQNMGIPYRVAPDRAIIVPAESQGDVKEIVAQGFLRQSPVSETPSQP